MRPAVLGFASPKCGVERKHRRSQLRRNRITIREGSAALAGCRRCPAPSRVLLRECRVTRS